MRAAPTIRTDAERNPPQSRRRLATNDSAACASRSSSAVPTKDSPRASINLHSNISEFLCGGETQLACLCTKHATRRFIPCARRVRQRRRLDCESSRLTDCHAGCIGEDLGMAFDAALSADAVRVRNDSEALQFA